ncbi:MAG: adenine phosphoribosyltransferase [Armatimonadetes bacterium]|jgi:adenine phosphoribosyltransferase|nr:adenine phosphoribosyltransferase [Armatimonadota bacterium]
MIAESLIRTIPDFPQKGILFRDITPVLADPKAMREVISLMADYAEEKEADVIIGIESRGFVFGAPVAMACRLGLVPVRKAGKLPWKTVRCEYALEYGTAVVEMHEDAVKPGQKCIIVDDLLATGGTAQAAIELIEKLGGKVMGLAFLIELLALNGRDRLEGYDVLSLIQY